MSKHHNLFKRGDTWWIRYNAGGKRVRRSLETTSPKEAKRLRDELLGKRAKGDTVRVRMGLEADGSNAAPVPTVAEVIKSYRADCKLAVLQENMRESSRKQVEGRLATWIEPYFGHRTISTLDVPDVRAFLAHLATSKSRRKRPLSKSTVFGIYRVLSRLLDFAVEQGIIAVNPCDRLPKRHRPKDGQPRDVVLTVEEAERLLAELHGQWRIAAELILYTGLRVGEAFGLAWEDVDLDAGIVTVRRSYQGATKTAGSAAPIGLHRAVVATLRTWERESGSEWLFVRGDGEPYTRRPDAFRAALIAAAEASGIGKHVTPHVLRHSLGSLLYEATLDVSAVQRQLRHTRTETTMRTYVHDRRDLAEPVNRLPELRPRRLHIVK